MSTVHQIWNMDYGRLIYIYIYKEGNIIKFIIESLLETEEELYFLLRQRPSLIGRRQNKTKVSETP